MDASDDNPGFSLTATGMARRDAMRGEIMRRVRGRGRRRRTLRAVLAVAVVGLGWRVLSPLMPLRSRAGAPTPVVVAAPSWRIVRDDPGVLARCRVRPAPLQTEILDDAGLQRQLTVSGRAPSFVRAGSRVVVLVAVDDWSGAGGSH